MAGAIASSAPVEALINFSEYLGVVRDSLGASCDAQILKANQQVSLLLKHRVGWQTLTKIFKLCDPLDATIQNDVANLVQTLGGNFEGIVQYNRDNRNFEVREPSHMLYANCFPLTGRRRREHYYRHHLRHHD